MRKTLFDSLMISGFERIHTQTLAWILSLENEFFPNKAGFIEKLFDLQPGEVTCNDLYVETELNQIDMFIQTDKKQFLIENKLQSSEHSNQTIRYVNSIPERLRDTQKLKQYGYLSLTNEEPKNKEWIPISFEKVRDLLRSIQWPGDRKETVFIQEYIYTLDNLVQVFNQFVSNHKDFNHVFTDGHKKKFEKQPFADESKEYIRKNQLETTFQKAFLKIIAREGHINYDEIGETRGTAFLQINLGEINNLGEAFRLGFQFQGRTLKINLAHKNYENSKPEQITEFLMNAFKNVFLHYNGYEKFNKPRSKAYISVSKTAPKDITELEKYELIIMLRDEIENLKIISQKFEKELNTTFKRS